jgi:catechol 2,3-dioxygenase-like lactoylglutathione lyase family enzyme
MADFQSIIIDHLNIGVADINRSRAFYKIALEPLGIVDFFDMPAERAEAKVRMIGFGREHDRPIFWLLDKQKVGENTHIAFAAQSRELVRAFYKAGPAAGATDHGAPGIRYYHPNYYGAFILDPDGVNVEAVCHSPE